MLATDRPTSEVLLSKLPRGCSGASAVGELHDATDAVATTVEASSLESLSYMPLRFDEGTTIDLDRSHARYSKIVVHSTRTRTNLKSRAWEEWMQAATRGRPVTLLDGFENLRTQGIWPENAPEASPEPCRKIPATCFLDKALSQLSIVPMDADAGVEAVTVPVSSIQVICPATDFTIFFDKIESLLNDRERARAVMLQFASKEPQQRRRTCFLEESVQAKEHCVQAMTQLWLEKRNNHSMWF